ncbi:unnamed protein product [Clonostachys chloroleuca]|uniref:Rhodopsin domain-containing protein n=1 Tax=Clonostachys chloroleuca TaxID=1926264 RepID=A0AA35PVX7_9HYPO|nr:unnamed protein product [Clonostachys chloroleuca]
MALPHGAVEFMVTAAVFYALALAALGFRLWSRHIQRADLAFNDYAVILGIVFCAGSMGMPFAACIKAGLGEHLQDIMTTDPTKLALFLKLFVPGQLFWAASNTSVKFSILSLYLLIFPSQKFHRLCYTVMVLSILYFISVVLEAFLVCKPVQFIWDKSIEGGSCKGENIAYLVSGITNLILDVIIVTMPMPLLLGLHMSMAKRLSIAAMFGLGIVICVLSLLRVIWIWNWDLTDLTYTVVPIAIWSALEPALGVVNACLPTMMPALTYMFGPGIFGFSRSGNSEGLSGKSKEALPSHESRGNFSNNRKPVNRDFERLEDEFPLTDIHVDSSSNFTNHSGGGITVTRKWELKEGRSEVRD